VTTGREERSRPESLPRAVFYCLTGSNTIDRCRRAALAIVETAET